EAITRFLERAHRSIRARNARLSIDIFGVVAWGKAVDISSTGQRIELLARHCDIISPMLYPSHFNDDFDGYARPGDNPYYFIYEGCRKVLALAGRNALVRPWLQAFRWRVSNYNGQYIMTQVKATNDSGAKGYLFWNASNDYDTVLGALERMNGSGAAKSREGE
ncbi:MAG TPA: putative glycoside hydrolase, partial [Spirochaetota bacterium]|nr:putative glycoside hydrolase [Spirochaetota bacterium]